MGRCTLFVRDLTSPFANIEEWIVSIPPHQSQDIPSPEFKLVLLLEGEVMLKVPGHPEIRLTRGDAYSLSFPTTYTYQLAHPEREARLHLLRLAFRWPASDRTSFPATTTSAKPERKFETALRHKLTGFQHFAHGRFGDYYSVSRRILSEMENQDESSAWKISGFCQALTAEILSTASEVERKAPSLPHRQRITIVRHAMQYLQENCHEILTLDTIAWRAQVSGEHLARLFRQETGRTVFKWLDYFRTEKARDLLATTEWPLIRIARACGYSSSNLLCRHFKQAIGHTPMGYRSMIQKGEIFSPGKFSKTMDPDEYLRKLMNISGS